MSATQVHEEFERYEFGPFQVDVGREILVRDSEPIPLTPKAFQILLVLLRHGQQVVTKDDLMKTVWPDTFVEEANLSRNVFLLRKALGEAPQDHRYIVTVPGRGYRFAEAVRRVGTHDLALVAATHSELQIEVKESRPWIAIIAVALLVLIATGIAWQRLQRRQQVLGQRDMVVLADFTNSTGDPVFDQTLRQGLRVQLEQSPFISMISDSRVQRTLKLMGKKPDAKLTPEIARDICERTSGAVVLQGSIALLGSRYVLGLEAKNCRDGETLDVEQASVARKEDVLSAITQMADTLRTRVGESLASVQKYSTPLEQATTPSLDALKAYSTGIQVGFEKGISSGIPFLERAVQIDPNFALAYAHLALWYSSVGESARSIECTRRSYELREHASDEERYFITAMYLRNVTGNLEAEYSTLQTWAGAYPRDFYARGLLSGFGALGTGRYEEAIADGDRAIEMDPGFSPVYANVGDAQFYLDRLPEAKRMVDRASERNLQIPEILLLRFYIDFVQGDHEDMDRVAALAKGKPAAEDWVDFSQALILARSGRLREARAMTRRAVDRAQEKNEQERAATFIAGAAVWEALLDDQDQARRQAAIALRLSHARDPEFAAAFALGIVGDLQESGLLATDLEKRFPEDTSVRFNYLPALHGLAALHAGSPDKALLMLEPATRYESAVTALDFNSFFGGVYPIYVRGEAYLAGHQYFEAAAEFDRLLSHRGLLAADPVAAMATIESARAHARAGQTAQARADYDRVFTMWKNADADSRFLRRARSEFDGLGSRVAALHSH